MSSYQGSTAIHADVSTIFDFVSDPENLSKFVSCITRADQGLGDAIHIAGSCPHGEFRGVGSLHVEPEIHRMRWDSKANLNYRGWLQALDRSDHCEVILHLEFDPGPDLGANREFVHVLKEHPSAIQVAIDDALSRIKERFEPALTRT